MKRAWNAAAALLLLLAAGCASPGRDAASALPAREPDWVQLTSGEWLKGRIKSMQEYSLDFDSDKLKDLTLDWEDVKELRTPGAACLFGADRVVIGAVSVDEHFVTVSGTDTETFPRSQLRTIAPGGLRESDYWSGSLSLGATFRSGNTNQTNGTAQASLLRRTPSSTLNLSYLGNYDKNEGSETTNNHRLTITYDRSLTEQFFVRPFLGQYYRDPLQNIANQGTLSAGAGYYFFNQPHLEWQIYGGPAYQYTHFETAEAGHSDSTSGAAAALQSTFEKKLTERLDLLITYQGILTERDAGLYTQHAVGTLKCKVTHLLDFDLSLIWDRTEHPPANESGQVPKRDDFQVVTSLEVDF